MIVNAFSPIVYDSNNYSWLVRVDGSLCACAEVSKITVREGSMLTGSSGRNKATPASDSNIYVSTEGEATSQKSSFGQMPLTNLTKLYDRLRHLWERIKSETSAGVI